MGIEIILQDDLMLVKKGGTGVKCCRAFRTTTTILQWHAVAALKADGPTAIEEAGR